MESYRHVSVQGEKGDIPAPQRAPSYEDAERRLRTAIEAPEPGTEKPDGLIGRVQAAVGPIVGRVLANPRVVTARQVMDDMGRAGGGLLAAGLAFQALFAILPALLLLVGVSGWLIEDPKTRASLVAEVVARFPPLASVVGPALQQVVTGRGALSILGLVGLAWGASNFYGSLDEAMARLFPGGRPRSFFEQRLRGLLGVVVLLGAALSTIVLGSVWSIVEASVISQGDETFWRLVSPISTALVMSAAVLFVFLFVPTAPPPVRRAILPALVVGAGIALLTNSYAFIAPRLVGGLAAFGVLAAVFAALLWFSYVFQLLMVGAAWANIRSKRP